MTNSRYGSRKYHLAILAMLGVFVLAWNGMLDTVAASAMLGAAGIYGHYNLKQKREEAEAKAEAEL
jgi:hypothetical protein